MYNAKEYYINNKEKFKIKHHNYYIKNKEKLIQNTQKWQEENKEKVKYNKKFYQKKNNEEAHIKEIIKKYKITPIQYKELLKKQNNLCAICFTKNNNKRLSVDHCHITGKVRGLLCFKCNVGLGNFKDKIDLLETAKLYLIQNN